MSARLSIKGLQAAQQATLRAAAAVKPSGGLGRAVQYLAISAHRYAVTVTHVDTGALRADHRVENVKPARWRIYLDPGGVNPHGAKPAEYGPFEESRGGSHAFYGRTYQQGRALASRAAAYLIGELP